MKTLQQAALECLIATDPIEKVQRTRRTAEDWIAGRLSDGRNDSPPHLTPGRPEGLQLVDPRKVPRRRLSSEAGRGALVHAVAHIEFNAINLAWDAVQRFDGLPAAYYNDWVRIADEEAQHFEMMNARLVDLGHAYGDLPAHNGLWDMAIQTRADPLARMALVPRVLEARGLDVTPGMITRLEQIGDEATARVLKLIYREEIGHVAAGTRWFQHLCKKRNLVPETHFLVLLNEHLKSPPRGPFNLEARRQAGFTEQELDALEAAGVR